MRMEDNNKKHNYDYHDPDNGPLPTGEKGEFVKMKNDDGTYKSALEYMQANIGVCAGKQIVPKEECEAKTETAKDDNGVEYIKRPKLRGEGMTVYKKGDPKKASCMSVEEFNKMKAKEKK